MPPLRVLLSTLLALSSAAHGFNTPLGLLHTPAQRSSKLMKSEGTDPALLYTAYNLSVPIDHFHNESKYSPHNDGTFPLRYWFDATYYKPGGPVIVLQSGETSGTDRLPFLQKGIVYQLAKATNGIGVILEHRYYGTSWPVPDLSTDNFRFLTTEQALADEAYFASNVAFPGLEQYGDLTAKTTAYISYGGSYAGAFSAFLRVQYPDIFWGSISSSGVTKAIWDYWAYFQPIAENGPSRCIAAQRALVSFVDSILIGRNETVLPDQLKAAFGYQGLTHVTDFAFHLVDVLGSWQALNWDPAVTSNEFYNYCDNITAPVVLYPYTENQRSNVTSLVREGGFEPNTTFVNQILNVIGYYNLTSVQPCADANKTLDQCYGNSHNQTYNDATSIEEAEWKSWPWQVCTEWGYLQTGNVPAGELPLTSQTIDLEYSSLVCRMAFNRTKPADIDVINKYGGYDISYPRLAIVDGDWDPWKPATPHGFGFGAKNRTSTTSEPFILIAKGVHHYDEYGLFPNETTAELPPTAVADAQKELMQAVQGWMLEWEQHRLTATYMQEL